MDVLHGDGGTEAAVEVGVDVAGHGTGDGGGRQRHGLAQHARASYSNYGSNLDIFAPGSSITSTWNTGDSA
ncbi:hypothetical protein ACWC8S_29660, partial [Streptomyces fungicidicus]